MAGAHDKVQSAAEDIFAITNVNSYMAMRPISSFTVSRNAILGSKQPLRNTFMAKFH